MRTGGWLAEEVSITLIPGSLRSCILTSSLAKIAFFCFSGFKRETHIDLLAVTYGHFRAHLRSSQILNEKSLEDNRDEFIPNGPL
jgi:hypothetical protein